MLQRLIAYCHKRGACKGVLTLMLWQIILFCFAASFSEVVGLKKKRLLMVSDGVVPLIIIFF